MAPHSLSAVLAMMAAEPGQWAPIAGGTELMVAYAAGRLAQHRLVSVCGLQELRFIRESDDFLSVGAGSTFQDIRRSALLAEEFPLLAKAASWIGSIANQSRATLGGNVANGSPAADSSPVLLVYDAEVELVSARGRRRLAYRDFHTGYKSNVLAADELLFAVHLPRRFAQHRQYLRKVGTRRAMAISKVALAATALIRDQRIEEIRMAAASLAPYPARLFATEDAVAGQRITSATTAAACDALLREVTPIDDIRSTAVYRRQVGANLLQEFLQGLTLETQS